jgi:DNA polymerase III sliding clamp (beta) subunit (PCNA family)
MIRIQREELIGDLQMVKAGISPREFIEQSSCVVFQDDHIITFNDEVACRKPTCLKGITGAVQAAALMAILEKLTEPELKVGENEKGELEFRGKKKAFGIVKDAEIFLPIDRVEVPEKWRSLSPEFTEAVGLVQHCVSTDENRFLLTCIHLAPTHIEACDNMQIMRFSLETKLKESVLVRGTSLQQLTSLAMDKISLTESWIHFRNQSGLIYSCRRYAEEYPNLDEILAIKGHAIVIPKGLSEASERAAIFAADKAGDPLMTIELREGLIRLTGEGLTGWYKEIKKAAYHGPPLEFVISPELLKHISDKHSDATINQNKLKVSGNTWAYVTVLGRKKEKKKEKETEE